jgi:hypothetical protein
MAPDMTRLPARRRKFVGYIGQLTCLFQRQGILTRTCGRKRKYLKNKLDIGAGVDLTARHNSPEQPGLAR